MQIDGVGSYLVIRDSKVTIGPVSASLRPHIGLVADPALPIITVERLDDDYFLQTNSGEQELLSNDDQLALGPRCRMKFRLPSAASTTAILQLSGARLPRADVRQIVLLDREIIVGPGSAAHIRCDELTEPIILYVQNGCLRCRTKFATDFEEIPMDRPVEIGPLSFTLTGDSIKGSD